MIIKIVHRGAMGYEPENTLISFKKALDLGVDMIELDVHLCQTGELVVIHDKKVNHTTNGQGQVIKKGLAELRLLDAGKGEKIPLLQEVFDLVKQRTKINIELKAKYTAKPVAQLIKKYVTEKGWTYNDFLVSSFFRPELKKLYHLNPEIKIGVLVEKFPFGFFKLAEKVKAVSIHFHKKLARPYLIKKTQQKGLKVFIYTLDNPEKIKKMKSLGIDGIFSNYPDRL
ncbi:glycerophosphodiester phosphodiesterase [Patescibacteria group bacterium]|nr:glycerophosphodiester phosphodiesterase [Patescibacteria group bacterium]